LQKFDRILVDWIERQTKRLWGARGDGWACYVRDPDGYRVELKIYEE